VSVPLYVFTNIIENFDPTVSQEWWKLPIWWMGFAAATLILSLAFGRLFKGGIRREATSALYLYNTIFVPLSIIVGVYGDDSSYIADLFLFTVFATTFYFNVYHIFFRTKNQKHSKIKIDWKKIFNPLIRITLLAVILRLVGAAPYIPAFVITITRHIGNTAFPLIMFILGGYICLDLKGSGQFYFGDVAKFIAIKNFVFPLVCLAVVYWLHPPFNVGLIIVLSAAAPPISTIPIFITRQHGNTEIANQFLVGSFLFCIVSIPLMISTTFHARFRRGYMSCRVCDIESGPQCGPLLFSRFHTMMSFLTRHAHITAL
jgi:predicted permease